MKKLVAPEFTASLRSSPGKLIVTAGAWLPELLGEAYAPLFKTYRQLQFWFAVENAARFSPERFPIFIWELPNSTRGIYGFPAIDGPNGGIKVASEQFRKNGRQSSSTVCCRAWTVLRC